MSNIYSFLSFDFFGKKGKQLSTKLKKFYKNKKKTSFVWYNLVAQKKYY